LRATPAVLPVVGFPLLLCHRSLFVGKLLLWGRLSSLRPAFQPALAPFTHRPLRHPMPRRVGADQRVRPLRGARRRACHTGCLRGACRQACHAGGHAGRATQSCTLRESQCHPARMTARSTSTRRPPMWSKPPGLPCRRSRRQSHTIPSCTGVPIANRRQNWRRGTHDCALHLNPPLPLPPPCPPCSLWFAFSVSSVVCFS